jgi:hypothetical protein
MPRSEVAQRASDISNASVSGGAAGVDQAEPWYPPASLDAIHPFHATPPNGAAKRRLLLVFFYYAPSAEVGALRWLALTRFGAERGWAVDVVTLHPTFMGTLDRERLARLPPGVRVFGFSGDNPGWYKALLRAWRQTTAGAGGRGATSGMGGHLDGNDLMAPMSGADAPAWRRAFRSHLHFLLADVFARRAAALGSALARSTRYDMVVSSGPPHAAHDAARRIALRAGLPFVMDMRDPWSDESAMPDELRSNAWRRWARVRERRCVSAAELVVVTSKAHEVLERAKYASLDGRITTVMNGADPEPLPASRDRTRFVIAFAGMIYLGRNPRALFRAAALAAREVGASPEEFSVEFMGDDACEGTPLTAMAADEGLGPYFRSHGFRPRREALEFLASASMLVSLSARTAMAIPAKLFEYTRFDAWILALAEPGSATDLLLRETDAHVLAQDDVEGITKVIKERYTQFRAGVRPRAINADGRFDRGAQAKLLFDALDGVASRGLSAGGAG